MPEVQFHQTSMGQRFYEHTMPELVRQLIRLNDLLEKIAGGITAVTTDQRDETKDSPSRKAV